MDVLQPLTAFYAVAAEDARMGPTHISVYMALLHLWSRSGGCSPVVLHRDSVMKAAKISARRTYHKCLRELHSYGYIMYTPSAHPCAGSTIVIRPL